MKQILVAVALVMVGLMPGGSQAATIFFDDFNNESLSLNHVFADKWTVSNGTVDLIGDPGFFDLIPGNGRYVDLDGTAGSVGTMTSSLLNLSSGEYSLTFDLAGSQRGDTNTMSNYGIDTNGDNVADISGVLLSRDSADLFSTVTIPFILGAPTAVNIVFAQEVGNNNNIGLLLDNVKLNTVPEPASLMLLGAGLAGIGIWRRKASK